MGTVDAATRDPSGDAGRLEQVDAVGAPEGSSRMARNVPVVVVVKMYTISGPDSSVLGAMSLWVDALVSLLSTIGR